MKSTVKKVCQCCKTEKSLPDYHRNRTKPDGHNGICKECQAKVDKTKKG
jgi:hypothetical protein